MITWLPDKEMHYMLKILEPCDKLTSLRSAVAVLDEQASDYLMNLWKNDRVALVSYGLSILKNMQDNGYDVRRYRDTLFRHSIGAVGWTTPTFVSNTFVYRHLSMLKYLGLTRQLIQECQKKFGKSYMDCRKEGMPDIRGINPEQIKEVYKEFQITPGRAQYEALDVDIQKGLLADPADNPDTKEQLRVTRD